MPLVPGCPIPKELYEIDQTRIVGLTIDPHILSSIRRNRLGMMGVTQMTGISNVEYAELRKVNEELEWARELFKKNPEWPVLDVTLRCAAVFHHETMTLYDKTHVGIFRPTIDTASLRSKPSCRRLTFLQQRSWLYETRFNILITHAQIQVLSLSKQNPGISFMLCRQWEMFVFWRRYFDSGVTTYLRSHTSTRV